MKKAFGMFALGMFFLIALVSLSSATYYGGVFDPYYGQGKYDSYSSYSTRTEGSYYGPKVTTTKSYDTITEKFRDSNGDWVDRKYYVREKRESLPQYDSCGYGGYGCYGGYGYGGYQGYYQPSYNNYNTYNYPDYNYRNYNYNYPRTQYWY
ncbi:MAG: hypothetical protein ABH864_03435 [archaeon]